MNNDMSSWTKKKLRDSYMSGVKFYDARQLLVNKGYSASDITKAADDLRSSATPEDAGIVVWLSKYDEDSSTRRRRHVGTAMLSGLPIFGLFYRFRAFM